MPCSLLGVHTPDEADFEVKVLVHPGAKVLYWAAEPKNKDLQMLQDWRKAYVEFRNAGVTIADSTGFAVLKVRKPQPYTVPLKGELSPHIHYRVCQDEGMMGRVETVRLDGKEYFENVPAEFANPQPPVAFVHPEEAVSELNAVAERTLHDSVMEKEKALDESFPEKGADLNMAFLPPV
jgi:protocatechuate 3,4-dioxygenase beta subunit